jgi:hypothetical protein
MPQLSSALTNDLIAHLDSLNRTRVKMEKLFNNQNLSRRDVEKVYEALYLRTITFFEGFVEELFFGLLTKRIHPSVKNVVARVDIKSDIVAQDIVFSGKPYLDWFPYKNTEELAKLYFRGGRPFTYLDQRDKGDITNMMKIRNVVAHQSTSSLQKFHKDIISNTHGLLPREKTAAGYLRSQFRASPDQNRFEFYQFRVIEISKKIAG